MVVQSFLDDGTGSAMASVASGGVNGSGRITLVDTTISNATVRHDVSACWVWANRQEPITAGLEIRLGTIRINYTRSPARCRERHATSA